MTWEIVTLCDQHLEDAAALAAARYRALRERVPLLPPRYEAPGAFLPLLAELAAEAPGVAATHGGQLAGFLLGMVIPAFLGHRTVYSPEWANGAWPDDSRPIYEELYGRLSADWVADGCHTHVVTMLAHDAGGIQAWHWFGFGLASVDAVRELEPVPAPGAPLPVRRATLADLAVVAEFQAALERHLAAPPVFWEHDLGDTGALMREPANAVWLAHDGDEALGCLGMVPANPDACLITNDPGTASIERAFTLERTRSRGVATALLNHALAWACAEGYERCAVDWEAMNYVANRFWSRWFTPVCYSLMRRVDGRSPASAGG